MGDERSCSVPTRSVAKVQRVSIVDDKDRVMEGSRGKRCRCDRQERPELRLDAKLNGWRMTSRSRRRSARVEGQSAPSSSAATPKAGATRRRNPAALRRDAAEQTPESPPPRRSRKPPSFPRKLPTETEGGRRKSRKGAEAKRCGNETSKRRIQFATVGFTRFELLATTTRSTSAAQARHGIG